MKSELLIRQIQQKDNHSFTIEWSDGIVNHYRLSNLQKNCPCANCNDEVTGKKTLDINTIDNNVRAVKISSVGRYAIKIQFTSGCSTGIYHFDLLRSLASGVRC